MTIRTHRDLLVWQKAMDLVVRCYELTRTFPSNEQFGLTSQLRRAAVSVPANIAEGHGRQSTREYTHFLSIANGSLQEVETYLLLAVRLDYLSNEQIQSPFSLVNEVGRMLTGLRRSLTKPDNPAS